MEIILSKKQNIDHSLFSIQSHKSNSLDRYILHHAKGTDEVSTATSSSGHVCAVHVFCQRNPSQDSLERDIELWIIE